MKIFLLFLLEFISLVLIVYCETRLRFFLNQSTSLIKILRLNFQGIVLIRKAIQQLANSSNKKIGNQILVYLIGYLSGYIIFISVFILIVLSDWKVWFGCWFTELKLCNSHHCYLPITIEPLYTVSGPIEVCGRTGGHLNVSCLLNCV